MTLNDMENIVLRATGYLCVTLIWWIAFCMLCENVKELINYFKGE